jgi:small conductance mechanosensitive channel
MQSVSEQTIIFLTTYGLNVLGAVIILIVGWVVARFGQRVIRNLLQRSKVDEAVISFTGSLIYFLILTFAVLAALAKFGVQTTSFVAVIGAAGFAVGFALQGSLANFAAGVLILLLRPFKAGDQIIGAGEAGTVKEITLFTTVLVTDDNVKILVPNGKLFGDVIKNSSAYDTRRVDLQVSLGYGTDVEKALGVISDVLKLDARILPDPAPEISVSELADWRVRFVIRPWVKKEDYWPVRFDLNRRMKESFDKHGIEIPFPQWAMPMVSAASELKLTK